MQESQSFWVVWLVQLALSLSLSLKHIHACTRRHTLKSVTPSKGAAAVLEYYALTSPLSQPRNMFLGQILSSVIGVAISKAFSTTHHGQLNWLSGALACAASIAAMALTNTVHPPAGATALLASTDASVVRLGWALVPLVALCCGVLLFVALLVGGARGGGFPVFWWSEGELGAWYRGRHGGESRGEEEDVDVESGRARATAEAARFHSDGASGRKRDSLDSNRQSGHVLRGSAVGREQPRVQVVISQAGIDVPAGMGLSNEERAILDGLCRRLDGLGAR